MQQVGFFRWKYPLKSTMTLYALAAKHYDLEMVFFDEKGIDVENEKVNGLVLQDDEFKPITTEIPPIINNTPYKHDKQELHNFLSKRTHFMFKSFGGKMSEYNFFQKEGTLADYLIPSARIKNYKHFLDFIDQENEVVFKPLYKDKGQGIFSVKRLGDLYLYEDDRVSEDINLEEIKTFYNKRIKKQGLLMSKFIESRTFNDHPFDIRIAFEKNRKGKWIRSQKYARVGYNNKITSNLSTGGGLTKLNHFLSTEYSAEDSKYIEEQINKISDQLPSLVEKMVDREINSIGLDLGIDIKDKKVYMFEINSYPGTSNAIGQAALHRTGYMRYYLDHILSEQEKMVMK